MCEKPLESAHSLLLAVFRLKHYLPFYVGCNSALTRYTELSIKKGVCIRAIIFISGICFTCTC